MKKRVLSLILALVMLIGVLPVNMLAAEPADELPAQQTVTIETSLDSALADGVYAAAQSPLPVSIRAEADGEAVEHTASLDGEALTGTQAADGWTAYELSFEAAGSYTLTVSAAGETQSRTIVYQPQAADEPAAEDPAEELPANDPELTPAEETPAEETPAEEIPAEEPKQAPKAVPQTAAQSSDSETAVDLGSAIGTVRVIVENNTADTGAADTGYGTWEAGAAKWHGKLVDKEVTLYENSTAMTCITDAVKGYTMTDSDGYITEIGGLKADPTNYSVGWMYTFNEWFANDLPTAYTAKKELRDGDEICMKYTCKMGADIGSIANDKNKTLSSLTVTGAELNKVDSTHYEIPLGDEESKSVKIVPTAANKNFLACVFKGTLTDTQIDALNNDENSWYTNTALVRRSETVTVKEGDTFTVVVGAKSWPSQNNGTYGGAEKVNPGVYTITVKSTASADIAFKNFFSEEVKAVADITNDAKYPFDVQDGVLKSSNAGVNNSDAAITFTFKKTAKLSFAYKASCEGGYGTSWWDYLDIRVKKAGAASYTSIKQDGSKTVTEFTDYAVELEAGDTLQLAYKKDSSTNGGEDCVYLKNFTVTLPNKVIFHANNGTDATSEQGVFGTADLTKNAFTYAGYRFDGWAETAGGAVKYADGASITLNGADVNLYAVWTKVWTVTFPKMPAGAAITVKQGETIQPVSETANTWILPDGSYTYSAALFGYVSKENVPFQVNGANLEIQDSLTAADKTAVTFHVTGAAADTAITITVWNSEKTVMTAREANPTVYDLPAGSYTYTVEAKGYKKIKNQLLTVGAAAQTVNVALTASDAWEGDSVVPTKVGDVYQITSCAELKGFADLVNGEEPGAKGILTKNITLNEPGDYAQKWTPMGASSSAAFTGDFDGNGKTITGLYMDGEDAISGLFGYVGKTGSIHDLTIADASVKSMKTGSYNPKVYTALAAASNAGTISNVTLKNSMISSGGYAGGIAALNEGTITGCANESAPVTHNEKATSSYYALAGGIAGQNSGTIALSYNLARVTGGKENSGYIGGIAGKNESAGTIESCYNRGDIQTGAYLGGITGYLSGTATNCYSTGSVPTGTYAKALFGYCTSYSAKATACFYLTGCGPEDTKGTAKTAEEFKTLAASLGGAFADADPYPTLKWQDPNATFTITLTVKPANASVTVTGAASVGTSEVRKNEETNEATYIYSGLNKGSYRWAVTCDDGENDYLKQEGSFTIATSDVTHAVTLAAKTYDINFIVDPVGADFILTQSEGEDAKTITPKTAKDDTGKIVYSLTKGSYHYTASCFGYADASGDVTVAKSTGLADTTVELTAKTGSKLTFTNIPADAAVTVTHAAGGEQTGAREGETYTFTLVPETYSYRIQRKGYKSIRGTVTMDGTEKTIAAEWTALTAWDGSVAESFSGSGTETDPYLIESGAELAYLSKFCAEGGNTSGLYYELTADIDLANNVFTPIAPSSTNQFKGIFNGAGNTISNLKIDRTESLSGLFGRVNGATIQDLTIDHATITSTSGNVGALVGAAYGTCTIADCVVKNSSVTGGSNLTGGLIGYSGTAVTKCAVIDTTVSGTKYVGGLIAQVGKAVTECYTLHVTVTATGDYAGGLIGGGNASDIANCFVRGGSVTGDGYVGGVIGDGGSYSKAKIKTTYAVADVTAGTGEFGPLAGGSYVTITTASSFYCSGSALTGKDSGKNTTGTPKTTAELKDAAILTRLGSAFGIYAGADGLKNAGFPYLLNAPALPVIQPQKLASPVITWTDKTASWTAVPNARGYLVSLAKDGENLTTETRTETTRNYTTEIELAGTGSYTITVTAIGDGETYGNSDPAENTVTITVNTASVTFAVTAEEGRAFAEDEPVITLTMADGKTTLSLTNNTAKNIPQGTYTYEVKAKTFATLTDTLNVTANQTVTLTMHYTTDWDGSTTVEPQKDGETYLISNSYELAWFRDEVNKGNYTLNARLTENINLGGHPWTAISKLTDTSAKTGYKGTFDGNGKTISGLNPVGELISGKYRGAGLFGYVYTGGTVKNVTVEGAMKAEWNCGGVVAYLAGGRVENCVNRMNITPRSESIYLYYVGGVVGYITNYTDNSAVIIGCRNEGSIDGGTTGENVGGVVGGASNSPGISNCANTGNISGKASIGGIAATASIPITACYNTGKITGASSKIGGIVGYSSSKVTNCYNTGAVAGAGKAGYKGVPEGVGGIAGQLYNSSNGAVAACLNSGTVTSEIYGGALVGSKNAVAAAVSGSYALAGSCTATIGSYAADDDEASFISAEELGSKRLIGLLGGAFAAGSDGKLTLDWQDPAATPVVTFVTPEGAAVAIEGKTPAEPGVFVLENGTYSYSVSKQGYNTATGSVTVNGESQRVDVNLGVETFSVTFNVTTPGAKITVTDAAGETIQPTAENANVYSLPNGEYHYTVSKLGCTSATGDFTVAGAAQTVGPIELAGAQLYTVTLTFTNDENASVTPASVTVKHADESVEPNAAGSFTYSLPDGTYTYIVDDARYYKVEATFTVSGKDATIAVQLETNKTWNGTDKTPVTPTDGVYEISTAAELAWFADQVNAGNTAYHARLTANIYVNYGQTSNTWTPIGDYSHMYTGTFDGNGKSVYGLTAALFGYTGKGALVKNVTVYGSNHAADDKDTAPKGGISNQAYGSFEGCVSHMTISAKWSVVGGIVGRLYATGRITDCANYGAISSNWTGADQNSPTYVAEVGGIAGLSSGPITRSFNAGAVTVAQKGYGGVGGIAGVLKSAAISDCYNTGTITGPSRTAGIVSIANDTASAIVKNCYNTGKIVSVSTSTNPACGTIAGTIANSNGDAIGSVENCYFLKGTYSYTSGSTIHTDEMVGYPLDKGEANCKLASEMKLDAFAITLSPTDKTFNVDAENINGGFPVLKWQGGRAPQVTQDAEDVAADKAALTVTPTTVTSAGKLELASTGANGSAITWKSSNPAIIADDGTVTLPTNNDVTVILTATITKNGVSDTKEFTLTVRTAASVDKAALEAIIAKLGTRFRVAYKTGEVNVLDTVRDKLADAITASGASLTADQITVTLADKGKTSLGAGTLIDDSGKVTYYYEDPSQSSIGTGDARVNGVTFTLSTANEVSVTTGSCMVSIPWDRAKVTEAMTAAAETLTFDTIKGENETSTAVTKTLTLPVRLDTCGWSTISWTSSSVVVTVEDKGALNPAEGTIQPNDTDTPVTLTATFTFNKNIDDYNKDVEAPITVTRTIEVTIPGAASDYMQTIEKICAEYTLARLTDSVTKEPIDPVNVTNDIQLLRSGDFTTVSFHTGSDGYAMTVTATAPDGTATTYAAVNGYRLKICRLAETAGQVKLTLTVTKKNGQTLDTRYTQTKELGIITVTPLKPSELAAELALLEKAKANFFAGINDDQNISADAVTKNLHAFHEARLNADGKLIWVYTSDETLGTGIVPTDLPGYDSMGTQPWRLFRSSNRAVIADENLLVTPHATDDKTVTITANLKSARFGGYYETCKDNSSYADVLDTLKKLAGEEVSVTVTVVSTANQAAAKAAGEKIDALFPVTKDSADAINEASGAYKSLTDAAKKLLPDAEEKLAKAEADYKKAVADAAQDQADRDAAAAVDTQIEAIGTVTLEKEGLITAARSAYEGLSAAAKEYVTKLGVLEAAEAKLNELKNAQGYQTQLQSVLAYIRSTVTPKANQSTNGDWAVMALARAGLSSDADKRWYAGYADELAKLLAANGGSFETTNENARLVLALTALGQNAKAYTVGGETYDLVTPLTAKTGSAYKATVPSTTSAAFAIIAIDSAPYTVADTAAVPAMIQYLLSMQNPSGAWKINDKNPADNVDATAMVLTALAPHKSETGVQAAIDKALTYLEGLTGYGNACTDAQLVTAYSALGIDCTDAKYARGGKNPLTSLLSYQTASGGFSLDSTASNARVSPRPTEQAAYALVAYDRFKRGVNSLYDMSDAVDLLPAASGAADVAAKITALGTVTDCKRETYLALQEIEAAYAGLTAEEQAEVTNYGTFLQQKQTFQTLLEAYRKAKLAELDAYYDKLKRTDYTTDQWTKITEAYRTGRSSISSAQYAEQADAALKQAKADIDAYVNGDTIEVSFRLIGDFPESYTGKHLGYVTWIETETYTVKKGSTVYDVFTEALQDAGLTSTGAASGYVRSITAPSILGGYTLSEFDNGAGSGWMFTVNGTHGNYALDEHVLQNGDRIVWHYVDNYATETSTWLTAADISPAEYARRHIGDVVTAGKHGKAAPVLTLSDLGRTVKFTFTPDKGCHVKDVKVNGKSIGAVESYTCSSLKIYDRITVEFTDGTLPFTDVRETDWFYDDIVFAYENGLFSGTTATTFSPYAPMTRAMLVTVLYRLEGEPAVTGRSGFSDVTIGSYYEAAVTWAADNGIVNGTSATTFSPSENVTREQMAAILCRYAQYKQYGTSASASLSAFSDDAAVSTYAKAPLSWAVAEKLVNGTDGKLLPRASATRAQVAAILHRFVENITK